MSVPPLRQPKSIINHKQIFKKVNKSFLADVQYVIVTLKDKRKLVVSSDAYHGVITAGESYKCVFCDLKMELDSSLKEKHKISAEHKKMVEMFPHIAQYSENLVRELNKNTSFCTICYVVISNAFLIRHIKSEVHIQEMQKAFVRADSYKPS